MSITRPARNKILILGGSGFIGQHLNARLGPARAVATFNSHAIPHALQFDALTMTLTDVLDEPWQFSHAVVLLGMTNPDDCARNRGRSDFLNVIRMCQILDELVRFGICPVFTSTEVVFDGTKGNYVETDTPNPVLTYGAQKVQVERYLQDNYADFLIVRLPRVLGSQRGDGSLFTAWLSQIERNEDIRCANDHVFSPLHIDEVVEGLIRLMERGCRGVFHLAGPNAHNRLDMLRLLLDCWQAERPYTGAITACSLHDFPVVETRPLNVSLNPAKLVRETGLELRPLRYWAETLTSAWVKNGQLVGAK